MKQYFVSPLGNDNNDGTELTPFQTIGRGLQGESLGSKLQPGDILTLREGTYVGEFEFTNLVGKPDEEITIRSCPGERAVIESRITGEGAWVLAKMADPPDPAAHDDEWAWNHLLPLDARPTRGAFLHPPYRRLVSYSTDNDFRADNETFGKIFDFDNPENPPGPWRVTGADFVPLKEGGEEFTVPWVYMGPGLRVLQVQDPEFPTDPNKKKKRVHVRLSHTHLDIPGMENYEGPTDPNEVEVAISDARHTTLTISKCRYLVLSNLIIRFGGENTILIDKCHCLTFDEVDVLASTGGIRFGALTGATFRNCRFDGGLPPWFFRSDKKSGYDYLLTEGDQQGFHNNLGDATIDVLLYGEVDNVRDFEIHHCEFVNGHDLYLIARNTHFHHNWIDNFQDEGMVLDLLPTSTGRIHSNVITRCLSPVSLAGDLTGGPWFIYRNLIDLRQPIAVHRVPPKGSPDLANVKVLRFGNTFKSNEEKGPDGPHDLFHNTFLVQEQEGQAVYLHYRSILSPHLRRSFNNIFIAVNSDRPITYIPTPGFPGPSDGNLYYRFGTLTTPAFRSLGYTFGCVEADAASYKDLDELQESDLFTQSQAQYPPGYEANSLLTDPIFRKITADGTFGPLDDLRLGAQSPARFAGVLLPSDLHALDVAALYADSTTALPISVPRDIGCYPFGSGPLRVGIHSQRRFPNVS